MHLERFECKAALQLVTGPVARSLRVHFPHKNIINQHSATLLGLQIPRLLQFSHNQAK